MCGVAGRAFEFRRRFGHSDGFDDNGRDDGGAGAGAGASRGRGINPSTED